MDTVGWSAHMSSTESIPLITEQMKEMFLSLGFNQMVAQKLVNDQRLDSPRTIASLSN